MGITWYPKTPDTPAGAEWAELDVPDPGYGRLLLRRVDGRHDDPRGFNDQHGEFAGVQLAALLEQVTALALSQGDPWDTVRVGASRGRAVVIERAEAVALLPHLHAAVVLATAGSDRYERVWPWHSETNHEPLCVHCNQGSDYSSAVTISPWCSEHGHDPFGEPSSTSWAEADERHRRREQLRG